MLCCRLRDTYRTAKYCCTKINATCSLFFPSSYAAKNASRPDKLIQGFRHSTPRHHPNSEALFNNSSISADCNVISNLNHYSQWRGFTRRLEPCSAHLHMHCSLLSSFSEVVHTLFSMTLRNNIILWSGFNSLSHSSHHQHRSLSCFADEVASRAKKKGHNYYHEEFAYFRACVGGKMKSNNFSPHTRSSRSDINFSSLFHRELFHSLPLQSRTNVCHP